MKQVKTIQNISYTVNSQLKYISILKSLVINFDPFIYTKSQIKANPTN